MAFSKLNLSVLKPLSLSDYFCLDEKCNHENCPKSMCDYVQSRIHDHRNSTLKTISFVEREFQEYRFSSLYQTVFATCSVGEFTWFMDNSLFFKECMDNFPYAHWKRFEKIAIRSIDETKSCQFLLYFLDNFNRARMNVSNKTKANLRKLNLQKFEIFLKMYREIGISSYTRIFETTLQMFSFTSGLGHPEIPTYIRKATESIEKFSADTSQHMAQTMTTAEAFLNSTTDASQQFFRSAQDTLGNIDDTVEVLENKLNQIFDTSSVTNSIITNIMISVKKNWTGILSQLVLLSTLKETSQIVAGITTLCSLIGVTDHVVSKILAAASGPKLEAKPATVKLLGLVSLALGKRSPLKMLNIQNMHMLSKEMEAANNLTVMFEEILSEWGIYDSPDIKRMNLIRQDLIHLTDAFTTYETAFRLDAKEFYRNKIYFQFQTDLKRLTELRNAHFCLGDPVSRDVVQLYANFKTLAFKIEEIRAGNSRRQEPLGICILGVPGIGKSELMVDLVSGTSQQPSILAQYFLDHDWAKNDESLQDLDIENWSVWAENKSKDMKYSDGFYGQDAHTVDDAFQNSDDSDHLNYINYISCSRHITNQADLESKGRPYEAKILIASANQFPTTSKTIKNIDALNRRFAVVECNQIRPMPPKDQKDRTYAHLEFKYYPDANLYHQRATHAPPVFNLEQLSEAIMKGLKFKTDYFNASQQQLDDNCVLFKRASIETMSNDISSLQYLENNYQLLTTRNRTSQIRKVLKGLHELRWKAGPNGEDGDLVVNGAARNGAISPTIFIDQVLADYHNFDPASFKKFVDRVKGLPFFVLGNFKAINFSNMTFFNITSAVEFGILESVANGIHRYKHQDYFDFPWGKTYYEYYCHYNNRTASPPNQSYEEYEKRYKRSGTSGPPPQTDSGPSDPGPSSTPEPPPSESPNEDSESTAGSEEGTERDEQPEPEPNSAQFSFWQKTKSKIASWMKSLFVHTGSSIGTLLEFLAKGTFHVWMTFVDIVKWPGHKVVDFFAWLLGIEPQEYPYLAYMTKFLCNVVSFAVLQTAIIMAVSFILNKIRMYHDICPGCSSSHIEPVFTRAHSRFCRNSCDVGYIYTTHTEECKGLGKMIESHLKTICSCHGQCTKCVHTYDLDFDERQKPFFDKFLKEYELADYVGLEFDGPSLACTCRRETICLACASRKNGILTHFNKFGLGEENSYDPTVVFKTEEGKLDFCKLNCYIEAPHPTGINDPKLASGYTHWYTMYYTKPKGRYPERDDPEEDENSSEGDSSTSTRTKKTRLEGISKYTYRDGIFFIKDSLAEEFAKFEIRRTEVAPNEFSASSAKYDAKQEMSPNLVVFTNFLPKAECEVEVKKLYHPMRIIKYDTFNYGSPLTPPNFFACREKMIALANYYGCPMLIALKMEDSSSIHCSWFDLSSYAKFIVKSTVDPEHPMTTKTCFHFFNAAARGQEDTKQEAVLDPAAKQCLKVIRNNTVKLAGTNGSLHGVVSGAYVLSPAHIGEICVAQIRDIKVPLTLIKADREKDLALWSYDTKMTGGPLSTKPFAYVPKKEELVRHVKTHSVGMTYLPSDESNCMCYVTLNYGRKFQCGYNYDEILQVNGLQNTCIPSQPGDCGAPLVLFSPKMNHKWIGMHVMGSAINGYSTLVTQEILQELGFYQDPDHLNQVDYYDENADLELDLHFDPDAELQIDTTMRTIDVLNLVPSKIDKPRFKDRQEIEYVGQCIYKSFPAKETQLVKHPLFGTFPVTQVPSALSLAQVKDPSTLELDDTGTPDLVLHQLVKYQDFPTSVLDVEEKLDIMVPQMIEQMKVVFKDADLGPLSDEEALSGISEDTDSNPLDMRTSAGEPWARVGKRAGKKKSAYMKISTLPSGEKRFQLDTTTYHGKQLKKAIDIKEDLAKNRIRTMSLWKNCLKDETRPIDKVAKGKTRLFVTAPFETVFLMRKYLENFKNTWQKHRLTLPHAVGINPMSPEWSTLARKLLTIGEDMNDADFAQFDGRLRADFMRAAGKIVIGVIDPKTEEERNILETLWEEMVETFHLSYNMVHLTRHGNPSGNPYTTVINCIVNYLYHWFCYMRITNNYSLRRFQEEVAIFVFGDDVIFSIAPGSLFTFNAVAQIMAELGQEYTNIAKDGKLSDMKSIENIKFLKRSFKKAAEGQYLAPLELDSIMQQFNYTHIQSDDVMAITAQLDEALLEVACHSREIYTTFTKQLKHAVERSPYLRKWVPSTFFFFHEDQKRLFKRLELTSQRV